MCALDRSHKRFSLSTLGHRLRSVPMFLALIPFVAGIVTANCYVLPLMIVVALFVLSLLAAVVAMPRGVTWGYVALALLLAGYLLTELRAPVATLPYGQSLEMVVDVEGVPSQREGYRVADGRVVRWRGGDVWHDTDCRVVLWLRADSVAQGDRLIVVGEVREHRSHYADYNDLMHRRGFVGGVAVNEYNTLSVCHLEPTDMQSRAIGKLDIFKEECDAHATVVAMVAGSRHDMSTTLRDAYSKTGLAHLMAVSGLHLGIVLMVVSTLLIPLRLIHGGHRLASLVTIAIVWLYAIMSGSSPSVVRAAIMLTVLLLSNVVSANYSSVNALAATIFAMLVYRPDYLYDVSFQLSVMAVFGIVTWGVPVMRATRSWSWPWTNLSSLLIVGVVATLWTHPIVSHTFDNLPIIGVVLTPCVLLFSYAIVACGLFALILPTAIAPPFATVAEWAAGVQNSIVMWASELPFASVEYSMSGWGVAVCYATYVAITLLYWSKNQKKVVTLPRYDYD